MNIIEQWKSIVGYEWLYEVSSLGRVKSFWFGKEKILKPGMTKNGYLYVGLCRDGKRKHFLVHRLVATAFLPNPMGLPQVNHKNEVKTNNCVENIEWCNAKYNANYGTKIERQTASQRNHPAKSKAVEASKYSDFRTIELFFASTMEAERNGFNHRAVSSCCRECFNREGNNKYKGLFWRYAHIIY